MSVLKNDIVSYIHSTGIVKDRILRFDMPKYVPESEIDYLRDDLEQYIYLYLLDTLTDDKIADLFIRNKLENYVVGIIKTSIMLNGSHFTRKFLRWIKNREALRI